MKNLNAHLEDLALTIRVGCGETLDVNRFCNMSQVQTSLTPNGKEQKKARNNRTKEVPELQSTLERTDVIKENTMNNLWNYESRMAFQTIYTGTGDESKFVLRNRRLFTSEMESKGVKYDQRFHFKLHETSQILDAIFANIRRDNGEPAQYGLVTIEASGKEAKKVAARWARRVRKIGRFDKENNIRYKVVYGQFIDDGQLLMVPADAGINSMRDLGLFVSSDPKAAKRVRRCKASHQLMLEFDILHDKTIETPDGKVYTIRHKILNQEFTVLDFNMDTLTEEEEKFVDGMNHANLFAKITGNKDHEHVKLTALIEGVGKGFGHLNELVKYDLVLFGTKREVVLQGDKAYIGILGELHMHDAYMDIQTFVNMGFYEEDLAPTEAKYWMDEIARVMFDGTEDEIRDLFAVFAHIGDNSDSDEYVAVAPEDKWASVRADELMIETKTMPVLFRRRFQNVFENSIDLTRGRIPMMRDNKFRRLNVAPNPLAFHASGRPCKELDTLGDDVCCWDLPEGKIWLARNPNTHKGEAVVVINRHLPELKKYRGKGFVFFGFGAGKHLAKLNGGDMDDSVLGTGDPRYIAKWESFSFPVTEKLSASNRETVENKYLAAQQKKYQPKTQEWNMFLLETEITRWTKYEIGLGTFINRIMLDILLSGEHKAAAIEYLRSLEQTDEVANAITFLTKREDYILRREASNSDLVIDWLQMRKGDKAIVDSLLDHSAEVLNTPVFPMCYAERIPFDRKQKGDFILVETKACRVLNALKLQRDQIIETARSMEWMMVRGIPSAVDALFPAYDAIHDCSGMIRSEWKRLLDGMKEEYDAQGKARPEDWYDRCANGYDEIVDVLPTEPEFDLEKAKKGESQFRVIRHDGLAAKYFFDDEGQALDKSIRIAIGVDVYRRIFDKSSEPKTDENGNVIGFPDGVPNFILHDLFTACEMADITGLVIYAKLNGYAKDRLTVPVQVKATSGRIYRKTDDRELGKALFLPDGTYTMSPKGVIVVAESHPELHSDNKELEIERMVNGEMSLEAEIAEDDAAFSF